MKKMLRETFASLKMGGFHDNQKNSTTKIRPTDPNFLGMLP